MTAPVYIGGAMILTLFLGVAVLVFLDADREDRLKLLACIAFGVYLFTAVSLMLLGAA